MDPADEPKPELDITLEEWIAASQACCGADPPDEGDGGAAHIFR